MEVGLLAEIIVQFNLNSFSLYASFLITANFKYWAENASYIELKSLTSSLQS